MDIYRNSHDVRRLCLTMAHDFISDFVMISWHVAENTWYIPIIHDNKYQFESKLYIDEMPAKDNIPVAHSVLNHLQVLDFKNIVIFINTARRIPITYKFVVEAFSKSLLVADMEIRRKYRQQMLISNICHSIRTPLNGILHMTNMLMASEHRNQLNEEHLVHLNQSAVSLANNIFDIVDVTQLSIGNLRITKDVFNVRELVNDVIAVAKTLLKTRLTTLEFYVEPIVPEYAFRDMKRIKQILINLLTNAFHNTKQGEVSLYLGATLVHLDEEDDISVCADSAQYNLKFIVTDQGNGMSSEVVSGLFKPPEILLNTKQYGIGLRVSYLLANRLGGDLSLKYTSKLGSSFEFNLITYEEEQPMFDSNTLKSLRGKRVLLLDDSTDKAKICKVFTDYFMNYVTASSYEEILILHMDKVFDLVICQTSLRDEDGVIIAEQLRTQYNALFMAIIDDNIPLKRGVFHERMSLPSEAFTIKRKITTIFNTNYSNIDSNTKLLVVEDEPINRIIIEKLLRLLGYTSIDLASNGKEALAMVLLNKYNVLLVDIRMPIMNGFELAMAVTKHFVANPLKPKMIGVTAQMVMDGDPRDLFDDFIYKPIDLDELEKKLMNVLVS